jgi:hypothetical protein
MLFFLLTLACFCTQIITYENGILKSFGLPNGQVVNVKQADNSYKLEYEYHYKDHQGNLRLAFRVKASKKEYKLTGEGEEVLKQELHNFANNGTTNQGGYSKEIRVTAPVRTGRMLSVWRGQNLELKRSNSPEFSNG